MPSSIGEIKGYLREDERDYIDYLVSCGQERVLLGLSSIESVQQFVSEIVVFDSSYPGGVKYYIEKCIDLLGKSSKGINPFDGWTPSVPPIIDVEFNSALYHDMEKEGLEELTHCGFVLIAGGLGERLGYNDIKVGLPIETFTNLSYLNWYIKKILSIQRRSKNANCILPFAIMTSENNHDITMTYLRDHNFFGMPEDQIYVTKQDCIPAVLNLKGEIACDSEGHIIKKPHGHGDIHFCLYRDHIIEKWEQLYDLHRIFFFQDTNTVNFHTMPCVASISIRNNAHMVSTCVKRRPHEQTGGLCKLKHVNGDEMVCNVEYNQLEAVIRNTIDSRGDYADQYGYSPFPGNCNNLCMNLSYYLSVITQSHGIVPEFINPKYLPGSKTEYLQPTRLESLMQDYPKLILQAKKKKEINENCIVTTFPRFMAWSPVKNGYELAALLSKKTGYEESPRSAEADILSLFRREILCLNECSCCNPTKEKRIDIDEGAHICLWPESGVTTEEIHQHIGTNVTIKAGSVLIIRCRNWYLDDCMIDGCCIIGDEDIADTEAIVSSLVIRNVTIQNKGWHYSPIDSDDIEHHVFSQLRGYTVTREEQCLLSVRSTGNFAVENITLNGNIHLTFEE